ncbi:MAG TPA: NUDIX domain-containing protein [Candidatus Saccharimonadales bacterium]|nr:NUDIX domain-containing protein [Candidatus Saccharimonadales bacterium]
MDVKDAYKFCPRCGKAFKFEDGHLQCHNCGLSFYLNPKPCANVVLVNDKDKLLLTKRAFDPAKGLFDFPGGFLESRETFEECAKRELKEELGIEIETDELHYLTSSTATYLYQNIDQPLVAVLFIAKLPDGARPQATDDVADFAFFSVDKLPEDKFSYPAMQDDMRKAIDFIAANRL